MIEKKQKLNIKGMTCANCALSIEKSLKKQGATNINVNFSTGEATFTGNINFQSFEKLIHKSGFKIIKDEKEMGKSKISILFLISLLFTIPLIAHMFVSKDSFLNNPLLQLCLTIPVLLTGGTYFIKSAYFGLKSGVPNMDLLVSTGFLAAFVYSVYGSFVIGQGERVIRYRCDIHSLKSPPSLNLFCYIRLQFAGCEVV